jgi:NAD(P)-dependent dehydrogenase (short-subunit alcohol dehydrogenase family)
MDVIGRREAMGASAFVLSAAAVGDAAAQGAGLLQGKSCAILGPDDALARAVADGLKAAGAAVTRVHPAAATEDAYQEALKTGPDVFVNLAYPAANGGVGDVSLADFRRVVEDTYVRTYLAMKYGTRILRAAGGGSFVTVTSSAGKRARPGAVASAAVSNGIMQMTRCAALECASKEDNVRVNTILVDQMSDERRAATVSALVFMAADAAVYYTGMLVPIDDGDVF